MRKIKSMIILLVFLSFTSNIISQNQIKSGFVKYSINISKSNLFQKDLNQHNVDNKYSQFKNDVENKIIGFQFLLEFNKNYSKFRALSNMTVGNEEYIDGYVRRQVRGNSVFFSDLNEKVVVEETEIFGEKFLVKSQIKNLNWKLLNETKKIGNYICHKAIATKEVIIPNKPKKTISYTAWYSQDLTFNFGPLEISGLPGLILQFSNNYLVYTATEINFSEKKNLIMMPTKGKKISKQEFNNIGRKKFEQYNLIKN